MAELEIHHETEHEHDSFGKKVGVIAAIIGVFLAVDTIESHRAHTDAVIKRTEANDVWAYYQAEGIKKTQYHLAVDAAKSQSGGDEKAEGYKKQEEKYADRQKELQNEAKEKESETAHHENQALRFDIGEGLLELGLVLSSLYFIAKRKLFPALGVISAIVGAIYGISGFFAP